MKYSRKDFVQTTVSTALDIVAATISGPIGIILPSIGKVILSAGQCKENNELKNRVEKLEKEQIEEIKKQLGKLYQAEILLEAQKGYCEIFMVEIVEIVLKREIDSAEMDILQEVISMYRSEGIYYENISDEKEYSMNDSYAPIDSFYFHENSIILNLLNLTEKENVDELVSDFQYIVDQELGGKIRKIYYY